MEPPTAWFLVGFVSAAPQRGLHLDVFLFGNLGPCLAHGGRSGEVTVERTKQMFIFLCPLLDKGICILHPIYCLSGRGSCEISCRSLGHSGRFYSYCSILSFFIPTWATGRVPLQDYKEAVFRFQVAHKSASCVIIFCLPTSVSPGFEGSALP